MGLALLIQQFFLRVDYVLALHGLDQFLQNLALEFEARNMLPISKHLKCVFQKSHKVIFVKESSVVGFLLE